MRRLSFSMQHIRIPINYEIQTLQNDCCISINHVSDVRTYMTLVQHISYASKSCQVLRILKLANHMACNILILLRINQKRLILTIFHLFASRKL